MIRPMFISTTKTDWFSYFAVLGSMLALIGILLEVYTNVSGAGSTTKEWSTKAYSYLPWIICVMVLVQTCYAWYLRGLLTYKPLAICFVLALLAISAVLLRNTQINSVFSSPVALGMMHFIINVFILSLFWWIGSIMQNNEQSVVSGRENRKYRLWAWLGAIVIFVQIILGGWVTLNNASSLCMDFQFCYNEVASKLSWSLFWGPTALNIDTLIAFYLMYRLLVLIALVYVGVLSFLLMFNRELSEMGLMLLLLIGAQIILILLNSLWAKSPWIMIGNQAITAFLLMTLLSLLMQLYRNPQDW